MSPGLFLDRRHQPHQELKLGFDHSADPVGHDLDEWVAAEMVTDSERKHCADWPKKARRAGSARCVPRLAYCLGDEFRSTVLKNALGNSISDFAWNAQAQPDHVARDLSCHRRNCHNMLSDLEVIRSPLELGERLVWQEFRAALLKNALGNSISDFA
jgi:hypothetical protein